MVRLRVVAAVAAFTMVATALGEEHSLVELQLELPKPSFEGTPLDYSGSNFEKPNYEPRPPFHVPAGVWNVAKGKTVTSSVAEPEFGIPAVALAPVPRPSVPRRRRSWGGLTMIFWSIVIVGLACTVVYLWTLPEKSEREQAKKNIQKKAEKQPEDENVNCSTPAR